MLSNEKPLIQYNYLFSIHFALLKCFALILHFWMFRKIQIMMKQDSYTKANESGEEAQKETIGLIDIGLPQSKN